MSRRPSMTAPERAPRSDVLDWLLEEDQPCVRYLTLVELIGRPTHDPEARSAREAMTVRGFAAKILAQQDPDGHWIGQESFYRPKYLATNWMLLILADLGLSRNEPRVAKACELWLKRFAKPDGGFSPDEMGKSHLCTTGNCARALCQLGYIEHPKVTGAFEWLAGSADKKGGWSCFGSGRNLDSWEGLSAFAVYPRERWSAAMKEAVEKGAEFFLERELHKQGDHYEPWYRFHYPVHYYYDLLVGLDVLTALGYGNDSRLAHAVSVLKEKRRRDGRWNLDAAHPDIEGKMLEWLKKHPKQAPTPFAIEKIGAPSKIITFKALAVLKRLGEPI